MAYICNEVRSFITQEVCEPIENWVSQQQQQCKNRPWPLNWFCWFVTVLVKVITWVIRYIVVEVIDIVCQIVMTVVYILTFWIIWAIDMINFNKPGPTLLDRWEEWFLCTKVKAISREYNPSTGKYDYKFKCNCKCVGSNKPTVEVSATTDKEAGELAVIECKKICK